MPCLAQCPARLFSFQGGTTGKGRKEIGAPELAVGGPDMLSICSCSSVAAFTGYFICAAARVRSALQCRIRADGSEIRDATASARLYFLTFTAGVGPFGVAGWWRKTFHRCRRPLGRYPVSDFRVEENGKQSTVLPVDEGVRKLVEDLKI